MASRAPRAPRAPRVAAPLSAYVLHRYEWSESSLVLDLFTREQGRIAVVARGARKPYSQLRGVLLPFQALQVGVGRVATVRGEDDHETPPEVQLLRSAEWSGGRPMPTGAALWSGFYLNELLLKLLARHDPHPRLFDAYAACVAALSSVDDDGQAILRGFELVLLGETGHLADLAVETASQSPLDPDRRYRVLADAGVVEEGVGAAGRSAGLASGATLVALQQALAARDIGALWRIAAARPAEVRPWLRHVLAYHLGGDDALRTRRVLRDAQSLDA